MDLGKPGGDTRVGVDRFAGIGNTWGTRFKRKKKRKEKTKCSTRVMPHLIGKRKNAEATQGVVQMGLSRKVLQGGQMAQKKNADIARVHSVSGEDISAGGGSR